MADNTVVHIGENSPEYVAFKMMHMIMNAENRNEHGHQSNPVDREWILRTYNQCRSAVSQSGQAEDILARYQPEVPAARR
jgi:hypothetical protein